MDYPNLDVSDQLKSTLDMRGVVSAEAMSRKSEELLQLQAEMARVLTSPHEGVSSSGKASVSVDPGGEIHAVAFDGSLTLRPSPATISDEFKQAHAAAQEVAARALRDEFRSSFGITIPEAGDSSAPDFSSIRADIETRLAPALKDPVLGTQIAEMIQRAEAFVVREFQGTQGSAEVTLNAAKQLLTLTFDTMLLQGIDNITLAEDVLGAWREAVGHLEAARRELTQIDLQEADPERNRARAEAKLDEATAFLRQAQL